MDAKLEEIQRKAEFAEELKGLREAAQWRKLRGEVSCLSQILKQVTSVRYCRFLTAVLGLAGE